MLVNYKDNGKKGKDDILPDISEGRDEIQINKDEIQRNKDSMRNLSEKQIKVGSMLESTNATFRRSSYGE